MASKAPDINPNYFLSTQNNFIILCQAIYKQSNNTIIYL